MRKAMAFMLILGLICLQVAGGLAANPPSNTIPPANPPSGISNNTKSAISTVPVKIKIKAGNTVMYATMKDNRTAQEFVQLLPLTLKAFDRIGLVKSTVLPHTIFADGERTRKYAVGSIFYWPNGSEVAFCYSDHLPETVVDIIHIGMIDSGVEHFRDYTGEILVEVANEVSVQAGTQEQ